MIWNNLWIRQVWYVWGMAQASTSSMENLETELDETLDHQTILYVWTSLMDLVQEKSIEIAGYERPLFKAQGYLELFIREKSVNIQCHIIRSPLYLPIYTQSTRTHMTNLQREIVMDNSKWKILSIISFIEFTNLQANLLCRKRPSTKWIVYFFGGRQWIISSSTRTAGS